MINTTHYIVTYLFIFFWGGGEAAQSLGYPRVPVTLATPLSIEIRRENGVNCFGTPFKKLCEENHNYKFSHNIAAPPPPLNKVMQTIEASFIYLASPPPPIG